MAPGAIGNATTMSTSSPMGATVLISNGTYLHQHMRHLEVPGAARWEIAVLTTTSASFAITYVLVTLATYRVSRTLHPFILFFSEGVANVYTLSTATLIFFGQFLQIRVFGDPVTEYVVAAALAYVCHLHYLLIAVNRACAIFFPLQYDAWWSRERIIASVVGVWLLGGSLELINLYQYFTIKFTPLAMIIYLYVQRCVTLPSLGIYSAALGWVLTGRLLRFIEKRRIASNAIISHGIDLSIFAYCFISFLPNCYHLFVRPPSNSFHFLYYALIRQWSPGVMLLLMSSTTREQLPSPLRRWGTYAGHWGGRVLRVCLHCTSPATVVPLHQLKNPQTNTLFTKQQQLPAQQQQQQASEQLGKGNRAGERSPRVTPQSPQKQPHPPPPPQQQQHHQQNPWKVEGVSSV